MEFVFFVSLGSASKYYVLIGYYYVQALHVYNNVITATYN